MKYIKVKNPEDVDASLVFLGETLSVPAGKSVEFTTDEANRLLETFQFLVEDKSEKKEEDNIKKDKKK